MPILGDIEKLIGAVCTCQAIEESGCIPNSPTTTNTDITPPPPLTM